MRITLATLLVVGMFVATSHAAIIFNAGSTPPTVDGADIANTGAGTGSWKVFSDAANPGQTFTTGSDAGYELTSFSFRHTSTSSDPKSPLTWSMRLIDASDPNNTTTVAYETGVSYTDTWVPGDWITFQFSSPVSLSANTTYGVDAEVTHGDWHGGIPYMSIMGDTYAGGMRYSRSDGDPSAIKAQSGEMAFHLDIAAIPEPASMALLGLGSLFLARRRKA